MLGDRWLFGLGLLCCLAGCGSATAPPTTDLGAYDGGGGGTPDAMPDATPDGRPPYRATVDFPFSAELHWADTAPMGPIARADFSGDVGTVVYEGATLPAVVYREIPFGQYDLAAILATSADNVRVLYAYCQNGGVAAWYHEALDEPVILQGVSSLGSCALPRTAISADVALLPFDGPTAGLLSATQAAVTGAHLQLDSGMGFADFPDGTWQVHAFDWVDCSKCGGAGWYELHSLLRRGPAASFGIFYLLADQPQSVLFTYPFRFDVPSVDPTMTTFAATWTLK